jgi:uncharacterized membrane protein YecN with MAPEG domain
MKELCDQINKIPNSNLYTTLNNNRITVNKKYFSDFSPFNFGHLGSMTIHAKSIHIGSESKNLKFVIEMNDLAKFSIYGSIILLIGFAILAILNMEFAIGFIILIFTSIIVIWSNVVHNWGISNFTKNWDKYIGTKV